MDIKKYVASTALEARKASRVLAAASAETKNAALDAMAKNIRNAASTLRAENEKDLAAVKKMDLSEAMIDRLTLTDKRIEEMAHGIEAVAALDDPVGATISEISRPNGLLIKKVRTPIGVIAIIFESRPNVTADSASLCIKSGNAVILRGGKEAINSNLAIARALRAALAENGLPEASIQLIETIDRAAVGELLKMKECIDLVMPRGGESLIERVVKESLIPVIKHYKGVCHIYLDKTLDHHMAYAIVLNAKCQRPGICNAVETLLVHRDAAGDVLPRIAEGLKEHGVELRGCSETAKLIAGITPATEEDWFTEYLDLILSIKIVKSLEEAVEHINIAFFSCVFQGKSHCSHLSTRRHTTLNKTPFEITINTSFGCVIAMIKGL